MSHLDCRPLERAGKKEQAAQRERGSPNNIAPLFLTQCLTPVPTRNSRVYALQSSQSLRPRQLAHAK